MDLPQTAAGIPAPGVDPSPDDLDAITNFAGIFAWLGSSAELIAAFKVSLGPGEHRLRDLVYVSARDWTAAIAAVRVQVPDDGAVAAHTRQPGAIEIGHMHHARRIARLRCGLRAIEELAALPPQLGGIGIGGLGAGPNPPQAANALALLGGAAPATGEPRLKLSVILDPTLDSELIRLPQAKIRECFNKYIQVRGATPAEDVEPTTEQISALAQVLASDLGPYADFAVFGPFGRRMLQKLTYLAWTFTPEGSWVRHELPGPPSFDSWWASFRVYRTTILLLEAAPPEVLDNYGEMVRAFNAMYGNECWFIIYNAEVRMRSEHFERLRRIAEREHTNGVGSFDPAKPWFNIFERATLDKIWWDENLHRPAMLFLTRCKSAQQSIRDGTAQEDMQEAPRKKTDRDRRDRSRTPIRRKETIRLRSKSRQAPPRADGVYTNKGKRFCDDYDSEKGCSKGHSCKEFHGCKTCRGSGHISAQCNMGKKKDTRSGGGHGDRNDRDRPRGKGKGRR